MSARSRSRRQLPNLAFLASIVAGHISSPATADPIEDFYKGRNVTLLIAHEAGTGYDIYGRTLARHIGRHIAGNPNIVVQNMLGASGITGANLLANVVVKDGATIGMFAHTVPLDPLIGEGAARFDPSRFNWIGNLEESVGVCAVAAKTGVATFADLKSKEVLFGASATTGPPSQMAAAAKNLLGAKIKLVHGYKHHRWRPKVSRAPATAKSSDPVKNRPATRLLSAGA